MEQQKSLVVITWDGISSPSSCILKNTIPNFDILIYDYSGIAKQPLIEKITDSNYKTRKNIQTLYDYTEETIISKCKPYGLHVKETLKMSIPFTVLIMQKKSI